LTGIKINPVQKVYSATTIHNRANWQNNPGQI